MKLADKDDRKLFTDGCKGVKAEDIFDRKKQNYGNFVKLVEGDLNGTRTMEVLEINTKWSPGGETDAAKRVPLIEGMINIFESNKASPEEIESHCNLIWADADFGADTPKYFKGFDSIPTDKTSLDELRNK